jgi:hypothetical protein
MKSKSKLPRMSAKKALKKKMNYRQAAQAIERKLEEIQRENRMSSAANNNIPLFGYRV